MPLMLNNHQVLYQTCYNKQQVTNHNETLLSIFYSIIYHFNQEHHLGLKINSAYKIIKDKAFEILQQRGLKHLRKIKHNYFCDILKKMYQLCEIYFNSTQKAHSKAKSKEFLMVKKYNIVFEDMIDKLLTPKALEQGLKELKNNQDGKIIDHIFPHQSLLDTSDIFYIGDSKYYKPNNEVTDVSKYKQFSYAKNIIQYNINLLNENTPYPNTRYRDPISEGYNITPNFFLFGAIENDKDFEEPNLKKKGQPITTYHFKERLFDRDTLFVLQYRINFLFVLKVKDYF
ncbi:hypothetical protein [Helicobacter cetorum]|uniref:Uncharacterized protein n=3 Tax=Helicobacter cetorum TaxID=138563 RepID=I0EPP1_HELC0|nr:hypothetical protein [Helicobacter cetorum]ABS86844.1 hypothetical protein w5 [Helicobacter cetorum]AFI04910.1 hypothetical protein HCW_08265 [Helicobacter cetorum MIT 00-7128]